MSPAYVDSGWRWLDRHGSGWGVVRLIREDSRKVAIVYDPEIGDEYSALIGALHILGCKAVGYMTANEAVKAGGAR